MHAAAASHMPDAEAGLTSLSIEELIKQTPNQCAIPRAVILKQAIPETLPLSRADVQGEPGKGTVYFTTLPGKYSAVGAA